MTAPRRKVLLVGWDAADWKVVHPLMDAGKMPTVARLVERGSMANLATLHPVLSPMLWTSIATGKRPFKHGIHGFSEPTPDGTGIRPVTNLSRKTKTVWNIFSQCGLTSNVVGWWPSHPAEPIRGAMVSNHFQRAIGPPDRPWPVMTGAVYPPELSEPLAELRVNPNELLAEHILPFVPRAAEINQEQDPRLASCGRILAECTTVNSVATWLMQHRPWNFMAVYFDAIDHFCHAFMRYHPPRQEHIAERDFELYSGCVEAGYRYHDMMLNTLLQLAGPETTVILMSDHGFHPDHLRPKSIPFEPAGPAFEHRDFGIFAIGGPGIRQDTLLHGLGLLDIAPTLLTLFGLPVGEDMDGRAIVEAFVEPPTITSIPSWDSMPGNAGQHPPNMQLDPVESQEAIQQLVDLGYIEPPGPDRQQAIDNTVRELRYNLARSYMDDNRHTAAAEILAELYDRWPKEHRFGVQLAACYQGLERIADLRATIDDLDARGKADAEEAREEFRQFVAELRSRNGEQTTSTAGENENRELDLTDADRRRLRQLRMRARYQPHALEYLRGCAAFAEADYERALVHLQQAEKRDARRPIIHVQIGEAYLKLRQPEHAERSFCTAGDIDPDSPLVHLGFSRVYLLRHENQAAAEAALRAIGLRYQLPLAHYCLGVALVRLGRTMAAVDALETALAINPHFAEAHRLLAAVHRRRLGNLDRAAEHRRLAREMRAARRENRDAKRRAAVATRHASTSTSGELRAPKHASHGVMMPAAPAKPNAFITVVSGLPRSGTSMVMQMLAAGGMTILTDGQRTADESNPRGYLELERVKNLRNDNTWLHEGRTKAVKIITHLLPSLPMNEHYRIVYVERDLDEILASQRRMLERDGHAPARISDEQLRRTFSAQTERIREWLRRQPNVAVLSLLYHDVVADPVTAARSIHEFVGGQLDERAMAAAVDPSLYRNRR